MVYHDFELSYSSLLTKRNGKLDKESSETIEHVYNRLLKKVLSSGRMYLARQIKKDMDRRDIPIEWRTRVVIST